MFNMSWLLPFMETFVNKLHVFKMIALVGDMLHTLRFNLTHT